MGVVAYAEVFNYKISFILAQLVSAQRLTTLFPLRKCCSVANLNINCLARHVCLEILLNKNRYYKSVWDGNFILFFLRSLRIIFINLQKKSTLSDFQKRVSIKRSPTFLCA